MTQQARRRWPFAVWRIGGYYQRTNGLSVNRHVKRNDPRKRPAVNRTDLLTAALSKLSDAVALLSDAGEERLAAQLEDIIHQVEISLLENRMPPSSQSKST